MSIDTTQFNGYRGLPDQLAAAATTLRSHAGPAPQFAELLKAACATDKGSAADDAAQALRLSLTASALDMGQPGDGAAVALLRMQLLSGVAKPLGAEALPAGYAAVSSVPQLATAAPSVAHQGAAPVAGDAGIAGIVEEASQRYGVPANLIHAVIAQESGYRTDAVSRVGAQGLMQLMPATARSLGVTDSFDPRQNVMGGTRFLAEMLNRYNGDTEKALAAYNWGPGNVDRQYERRPSETRIYVAKVLSSARSV